MKLSDAEWQWDGRKLTFYFTAEKRVDFRNLVRELASSFRTRIELKQIGVRDEATTAMKKRILPPPIPAAASISNPVDMVASAGPDEYRRTIETVLAASEVDALIVAYTPVDTTGSEDVLAAICDGVAAPDMISFIAGSMPSIPRLPMRSASRPNARTTRWS